MTIFDKIIDFNFKNNTGLINMTSEFFVLLLKRIFESENDSLLVVTPNIYECRKLFNMLGHDKSTVLFEDDEISLMDGSGISPELRIDRINILNDILVGDKKIVFTDMRGYLKRLVNPSDFGMRKISLRSGDTINRDEFIGKLDSFGYSRNSIVSKMGDYAVRGFVIDVFPVNEDSPVRFEFFDDEIESIRYFDLDLQKSTDNIFDILILPFNETNFGDSNICDYLNNPIVIFKDYEQIRVSYSKMVEDNFELGVSSEQLFFALEEIRNSKNLYYFDFDSVISDVNLDGVIDFGVNNIPSFCENFTNINKFVTECISDNKTVIISTVVNNFNYFLEKLNFDYVITNFANINDGKVNIVCERLAEGFERGSYVFLTDYELFGKKSVVYKRSRFKNTSRIRDLSKINIGDYVVHSLHGIGIYNGIRVLNKGGIAADYLEVLYANGDKLYIPASKIELISKYNGKDGYVPHVNALNSTSWVKTKQRIREKIKYEAEKLIRIQAERTVKKGFAFSPDQPISEMFESEFIYEPTRDQVSALKDIKTDMESSVPMDRILCGDVGYGKTEVAFRAIFKAVLDSKQVLYLCPTTLLCRQHYETALERFKNYPVNIGVLNRFVSGSAAREVLSKLESGEIDVLFATHRGLSDDVVFKDLGLLVIDEEQRFGVVHKEKIKEIKSNVDVLTLTATPIPRTLQMAVLGIKSMSLLETPPRNKKSVVTYVTPFDKKLIREVIYKEVSRGGQVFILYNYVQDIERKVMMFRELVPDVSVNFAHGRMDKDSFEEVMDDFVSGKFDVLVCTTIIETGIDIPNVNSLIILDADRFGLSQLYQIRGRVGRGDNVGYAYLMYEKGKVLTETAVKRLKVIKDFTELGSGFSIATRDLSIRGAGDILGSEQAGFIDTVGMDLYLKMLNEEVDKLKGIETCSLDEDVLNINVLSHIKDSYVKDEDIKIEIHKLINTIDDFDTLESVRQEICDRFGKPDDDLLVYMQEQLFESFVKKLGIFKVFDNSVYREIFFDKNVSSNINYEEFFMSAININNCFNFSYKNKILSIKLMYKDASCVVNDFNRLLKELI